MSDQGEQYENSWILYHVLDRFIGSREIVAFRRKKCVLSDQFDNQNKMGSKTFSTGSKAEGMDMQGSDDDQMFTDTNVTVLCPYSSNPPDYKDKTVLITGDTDSRPGYVTLKIVHIGESVEKCMFESMVPVEGEHFISSEIYAMYSNEYFREHFQLHMDIHGPASNIKIEQSNLEADLDIVTSLRCYSWPKDADEWVTRPRIHNWPEQALIEKIVQGGFHLVPVGDKTSADTFLQWRISFTTAERKLIYSFTHVQFLVYGLLKYFLKQISETLKQLVGDEDILSSYIIKTVLFHAVESTPDSFWQEKNTFSCFMFCLNILISWVKVGYCPNYFINKKNMFLGKVHGENQEKLLHFLVDLHDKKWGCLSVGTFIQPSIGERMNTVRNGSLEYVLQPSKELERECDLQIMADILDSCISSEVLHASLAILSKSKSDMDEFVGYASSVRALCCTGMETFEKHIAVTGNKEKYKSLKKSKKLLTPLAAMFTSEGQLTLATYYYQTGNYNKALEICGNNSFSIVQFCRQSFCCRGNTLLQKCKAYASNIRFNKHASQFCPSQLHQEIRRITIEPSLAIPPLPFAAFLSFLCYHELGDTRRRDAALIHLWTVKYDEEQGVGCQWIVHNLLGICYEMVGDTKRALREYRDSLTVRNFFQYRNPAKQRIERLQQL
ncbi:uncharacterized protein LOC117337737 [Pecten maximus]|uniref:uncharacterized protein LOC117337737 n=1 Tax=Pecten maximus TaxID=6579 RepID=UPI001458A06E|nr:uncharacterized protein LOC117337737 [Pecten maximus]